MRVDAIPGASFEARAAARAPQDEDRVNPSAGSAVDLMEAFFFRGLGSVNGLRASLTEPRPRKFMLP